MPAKLLVYLGGKHRGNLMVCVHCRIILWLHFFVPFHTIHDRFGNKRSLEVTYSDEDDHISPLKVRNIELDNYLYLLFIFSNYVLIIIIKMQK